MTECRAVRIAEMIGNIKHSDKKGRLHVARLRQLYADLDDEHPEPAPKRRVAPGSSSRATTCECCGHDRGEPPLTLMPTLTAKTCLRVRKVGAVVAGAAATESRPLRPSDLRTPRKH